MTAESTIRRATRKHWEETYERKKITELSWYQARAETSIRLIARASSGHNAPMIDVGGGASTLVDTLLAENYSNLTVLDIAEPAIRSAAQRLGAAGSIVKWIAADITQVSLPQQYEIWHDRAVFHFLTDAEQRRPYVTKAAASVSVGGHLIIATFAIDGPQKCSGLEVSRYDSRSLHAEFAEHFELIESLNEIHHTPSGTEQKFVYCLLRKSASSGC
jgi:2-polyprenyl-3-methyl-5-hydroxy-6-metoxy-1,4-benzoquinol methylase